MVSHKSLRTKSPVHKSLCDIDCYFNPTSKLGNIPFSNSNKKHNISHLMHVYMSVKRKNNWKFWGKYRRISIKAEKKTPCNISK